jgi:hypothetical protein
MSLFDTKINWLNLFFGKKENDMYSENHTKSTNGNYRVCSVKAESTYIYHCDLKRPITIYEGGSQKNEFVYKKFCVYFYITKL